MFLPLIHIHVSFCNATYLISASHLFTESKLLVLNTKFYASFLICIKQILLVTAVLAHSTGLKSQSVKVLVHHQDSITLLSVSVMVETNLNWS